MKFITLFFLVFTCVFAACGEDTVSEVSENTEEMCADKADNDGDGAVDCADVECAAFCIDTDPVIIDWDWVGIVGTGQSLAVGGTPAVTDTQPYNNLMLDLGNLRTWPFDAADEELSMAPLVEPIRRSGSGFPRPYPTNLWGETPHAAMANQITKLLLDFVEEDYITAHTVVGESGQPLSVIEKGAEETDATGHAYLATLFEVEAIARLAAEQGKTYGIGAVVLTHGEADWDNTAYAEGIVRLWEDYNTDLPLLTGQDKPIPMFVSQQHSFPEHVGSRSPSTQAQWQASLDHPGEIVCTGPKYQYDGHGDAVHLSVLGYRQYGEKLGEIYYEKVVRGRDWHPLQPIKATKDGGTVTVQFHVPVPPMVWDDDLSDPHQEELTEWAAGRGFEVKDASGRVVITAVEIVDDTVVITCDEDLTESDVEVAYAASTGGIPMEGGAGTIRWGRLRDSDPFVGRDTKTPLPNFGVAFEMDVR